LRPAVSFVRPFGAAVRNRPDHDRDNNSTGRAQSLVERGDTLYHNRCAGCHGEQLKAFAGGPAFDLRRLRPDEHDRFVESVISGKDNMPSWYGILKADEIEAIWAYIRATVDR
jgi:mono/diheme cytochrome c family protein